MEFVVVTSIASPNKVLQNIAEGCKQNGYHFIVIGDKASPNKFELDGCEFYSLTDQYATKLKLAQLSPIKHYSRKNIGYLLAIKRGATRILETDDDNLPYESFWQRKNQINSTTTLSGVGWVNIYRYFTDQLIWPRGLPLENIHLPVQAIDERSQIEVDCPIHQGLADGNPDVDAVYRLIFPSETKFLKRSPIAITNNSWCPFNSQNTTWFPDAFPLLYLPSYCSFRMTDIWRSFVAQAICWANNWGILFHESTVFQERNEHTLIRDFQDEIPGYLGNKQICDELEQLPLKSGKDNLSDNLLMCYKKLVSLKIFENKELDLLDAWLNDLQ